MFLVYSHEKKGIMTTKVQDVRVILSFIETDASVLYVRSCLKEERHVLKAEGLGPAMNMVHEGGAD